MYYILTCGQGIMHEFSQLYEPVKTGLSRIFTVGKISVREHCFLMWWTILAYQYPHRLLNIFVINVLPENFLRF